MTLSFHFPFYSVIPRSDTDFFENHEGVALRTRAEIPYMSSGWSIGDSKKPGSARVLCESQVSLLMSISNVHGCTAYLFEDTYSKSREPTTYWDSFCSSPEYYFPDALSSGRLDSTRYIEPRMYFLNVFQVRIEQVYREWRVVIDTLEGILKR